LWDRRYRNIVGQKIWESYGIELVGVISKQLQPNIIIP